jgi:hypothetical protein
VASVRAVTIVPTDTRQVDRSSIDDYGNRSARVGLDHDNVRLRRRPRGRAWSLLNEWDPLEEVVVGRLEGAAPPAHVTMVGNLPRVRPALPLAGRRYRSSSSDPRAELDGFVRLLEREASPSAGRTPSTSPAASRRRTGDRMASALPACGTGS